MWFFVILFVKILLKVWQYILETLFVSTFLILFTLVSINNCTSPILVFRPKYIKTFFFHRIVGLQFDTRPGRNVTQLNYWQRFVLVSQHIFVCYWSSRIEMEILKSLRYIHDLIMVSFHRYNEPCPKWELGRIVRMNVLATYTDTFLTEAKLAKLHKARSTICSICLTWDEVRQARQTFTINSLLQSVLYQLKYEVR